MKTLVVICNLKKDYFWFRRVHGSSSMKVPIQERAVRHGEIWDSPSLVTRSVSETQERAHVWDGLWTRIGKGAQQVAFWLLETRQKPQSQCHHHAEDKLNILSSLVARASLTWYLLKQYPQCLSSFDFHWQLSFLFRSSWKWLMIAVWMQKPQVGVVVPYRSDTYQGVTEPDWDWTEALLS